MDLIPPRLFWARPATVVAFAAIRVHSKANDIHCVTIIVATVIAISLQTVQAVFAFVSFKSNHQYHSISL